MPHGSVSWLLASFKNAISIAKPKAGFIVDPFLAGLVSRERNSVNRAHLLKAAHAQCNKAGLCKFGHVYTYSDIT